MPWLSGHKLVEYSRMLLYLLGPRSVSLDGPKQTDIYIYWTRINTPTAIYKHLITLSKYNNNLPLLPPVTVLFPKHLERTIDSLLLHQLILQHHMYT